MSIVAALFAAVLTLTASRYGYHRDEMYFLAAGHRLDWGYPDQPPLTPLLARVMFSIDSDSLLVLRLPSIFAATLTVICAGLISREFGGGRGAQALAAAAVASAALTMGTGHLLSTATFDLAVWAMISLMVVKLLGPSEITSSRPSAGDNRGAAAPERSVGATYVPPAAGGDPRWWLAIGVVAGIGLENKLLPFFLLAALTLGLLIAGPRKVFATKLFPIGVAIAALLWFPYVRWQAENGWPQWTVGKAIAAGSSGTSDSPAMFALLQFGLMGPVLAPMWGYGLWWLWRSVRYRAFTIAYLALFLIFLSSGGKAYYLGGMYPVLLAAAAPPLAAWCASAHIRWATAASVIAANALVSAILFLPVLPISVLRESPVLAVNYDAGETIGWPRFVRQIADVRTHLGPQATIVTATYGEAAAIERFGAAYDLPTPHSGHNAYWWWGPPEDSADTVIAVGLSRRELDRYFIDIEQAARIDNGIGIDNDEQGQLIFICRGRRAPWAELWPQTEHLG